MTKSELNDLITQSPRGYTRILNTKHRGFLEKLKKMYPDAKNIGECSWLYINGYSKQKTCKCGEKLTFLNVNSGYREKCKSCYETDRVKNSEKYKPIDDNKRCKVDGCNNRVMRKKNGYISDFCSQQCANRYNSLNSREKAKHTLMKNHGVEYALQSKTILEKVKKKYIKTLGVDNPAKSDHIKKKIKETNIRKYGHVNPMQCEEIKNKHKQNLLNKYGVENISRLHLSKNTIDVLDNQDVFKDVVNGKTILQISNELKISYKLALDYVNLYNCRDVIAWNASTFEIILREYVASIVDNVIVPKRSIIPPYELDIYLPDHNIAIECNGSYWHSELNKKDKNYHLTKTKLCQEKGIHLIHIWEHDWINNPEMVKTRIKAKLGLLERIYARNCEIKELNNKEATEFLDEWHIQGNAPASVKYGLYHNDELVSVMTFGKSRYKKDIEWELIRYCSIKTVIGGAQRLFKQFIRDHNPKSIISYSDKQWNTGDLYNNLGFEYSHSSNPSYYYTRDYLLFENRVAYQKHKLPKKLEVFDPNMTEWENMKINGYDRIWDCGTDVWIWKK